MKKLWAVFCPFHADRPLSTCHYCATSADINERLADERKQTAAR